MTRFPTVDPAPERELRERLGDVLLAGREASEEEALLVGLLGPLARIDSLWLGSAQSCAQAREGRRRTMRRGQRGARRDPCGASRSRRGHRHRRRRLRHHELALSRRLPALLPTCRPAAGERALGPGFCCPVRSTRCSSQERSARTATEQERCLGPLACRVWAQRGPTAAVGSRRCAWTGSIGARGGGWLSPRCSSRCGGGAETGVGVEVGRARSSSRRQANPIRRVR